MEYNTKEYEYVALHDLVVEIEKNATKQATIYTGALNDDYVVELKENHDLELQNPALKNYKAVVVYYTFASSWHNNLHIRFFTSLEEALSWYRENYADRVIAEGRYSLYNDAHDNGLLTPDELALDYDKLVEKLFSVDEATSEWENITSTCLA